MEILKLEEPLIDLLLVPRLGGLRKLDLTDSDLVGCGRGITTISGSEFLFHSGSGG